MEKQDQYYSFAYKGQLISSTLDDLGISKRKNYDKHTEAQLSGRLSLALLDEELVNRAREMSIVYTAIAAFENSVRKFIIKVLSDKFGDTWWDQGVKDDIRQKAEGRIASENTTRWHTPRGESPIYYTDFGDLISVFHKNWDVFEAHIQSIDWAKNIIVSLEKSRNVIMHSGEIANADIERIGTLIRDWLRQIGN